MAQQGSNQHGGGDEGVAMPARIAAVQQLLDAFKPERYAYLLASLLAVAVLLFAAGRLAILGKMGAAEIAALGTGTGGFLLAIGRILKMWSQALQIVIAPPGGGASNG